jgi:AcrR family transcriptional regulator
VGWSRSAPSDCIWAERWPKHPFRWQRLLSSLRHIHDRPAALIIVGRRELKKSDKLRRIKHAARAHFIAKDFDNATIRDIAVRAGVAIGTLFLYVANKRDLLFLVVNDDLDEAVSKAAERVRSNRSTVDNYVAAFSVFYRYYRQQPKLARMFLREMTFYEGGEQAQRFLAARQRLIALATRIAEWGIASGELDSRQTPDFVAWLVFSIFQVETRRWLSTGELSIRQGTARLRRALTALVEGVAAKSPTKCKSGSNDQPL